MINYDIFPHYDSKNYLWYISSIKEFLDVSFNIKCCHFMLLGVRKANVYYGISTWQFVKVEKILYFASTCDKKIWIKCEIVWKVFCKIYEYLRITLSCTIWKFHCKECTKTDKISFVFLQKIVSCWLKHVLRCADKYCIFFLTI